jgi:hypothetical protein
MIALPMSPVPPVTRTPAPRRLFQGMSVDAAICSISLRNTALGMSFFFSNQCEVVFTFFEIYAIG